MMPIRAGNDEAGLNDDGILECFSYFAFLEHDEFLGEHNNRIQPSDHDLSCTLCCPAGVISELGWICPCTSIAYGVSVSHSRSPMDGWIGGCYH